MFLLVEFPSNKAGLATVGYAQYTSAGAVAVARTTTGVVDMGNGAYGVVVTPHASAVMVKWDTGEAIPLYAHETIIAAQDVWNVQTSQLTLAGSVGKHVVDQTDVTIASAVLTSVIDGSITTEQALRVILASIGGKRQGLGTATEEYLAQDGITTRITFTPDAAGNGTPILNGAP